MDNLIFEFPKSTTERIRIRLNEFKGRRYLDLRIFYNASDKFSEPEWKPSKKGITLSADLDSVEKLIEGLEKTKKELGGE